MFFFEIGEAALQDSTRKLVKPNWISYEEYATTRELLKAVPYMNKFINKSI